MSTLLLSLLLLLLVGIGALMSRRVVAMERFQDAPPTATAPEPIKKQLTGTINLDVLARDVAVQDAVLEGGKKHNNGLPPGPINILPNLGPSGQYTPPAPNPTPYPPHPAPNPDPYPPRPAPNPNPYQPNPPPPPSPGPSPNPPSSCGWCPACPDMSQYIRMDEIPCWNCTLP